ncbi:MAG: hypothetical protein ACREJN_15565 [Nitrospiraceae bacterium]
MKYLIGSVMIATMAVFVVDARADNITFDGGAIPNPGSVPFHGGSY